MPRRTKLNQPNELVLSGVTPKDITRFWNKVNPKPTPEGCWIWTGSTDENNYGQFHYDGQCVGAHRFAYALCRGVLEGGKHAHHTEECTRHDCVNPNHISPETVKANSSDGGKRRHAPKDDAAVSEMPATTAP